MPERQTPAPVRRDATALVGVLLQTVASRDIHRPVIDRLCARGLDLLEAITHALADIDREHRLIDADAALQSLRCLLRMAGDLAILDADDEVPDFLAQADRVGRQIGGWLAHLSRVA